MNQKSIELIFFTYLHFFVHGLRRGAPPDSTVYDALRRSTPSGPPGLCRKNCCFFAVFGSLGSPAGLAALGWWRSGSLGSILVHFGVRLGHARHSLGDQWSQNSSSGARKAGIPDATTISGTPSGSSRSQFRLLGTRMRGLAGQVVRPEFHPVRTARPGLTLNLLAQNCVRSPTRGLDFRFFRPPGDSCEPGAPREAI